MWNKIQHIDTQLRHFFQHNDTRFARFAIAIVYLWFGCIKLVGMSPATPLVLSLYENTIMPVLNLPFSIFYSAFAGFEVLIGVLILIPQRERSVLPLLALHMFTTILPLFLVPDIVWQSAFVPTLEGQYIIKNIVIIALAIDIAAGLKKIQKPTL